MLDEIEGLSLGDILKLILGLKLLENEGEIEGDKLGEIDWLGD